MRKTEVAGVVMGRLEIGRPVSTRHLILSVAQVLGMVLLTTALLPPRHTRAEEFTGAERFAPFADLIGRWEGTSEKPDGSTPGIVEKTFAYALGDAFLRIDTILAFPAETADSEVDVRRELHLISWNADEQRYVARGFFSEGFATLETVAVSDNEITLESVDIENGAAGMRTRNTLRWNPLGELEQGFEIEMPGVGWQTYQTMRLRRVGTH